MRYLISEQELKDLKEGTKTIEDLTVPEKLALCTWSGEDVKVVLQYKKLEFTNENIEDIASGVYRHIDVGDIFDESIKLEIEEELKRD